MRGVASGENGNHSGPLPSVGMYLDEQPITTIQGALDVHVYDIARVEALAGPQGTLYGASSQAGTIRIITNKPDPSGFKAGYDLAGQHRRRTATRAMSAKASSTSRSARTAAVRLVGWYRHDGGLYRQRAGLAPIRRCGGPGDGNPRDGTITNATASKKNYNDVDTYGARAALRIDLNDNWTITPQRHGPEAEGERHLRRRPARSAI